MPTFADEVAQLKPAIEALIDKTAKEKNFYFRGDAATTASREDLGKKLAEAKTDTAFAEYAHHVLNLIVTGFGWSLLGDDPETKMAQRWRALVEVCAYLETGYENSKFEQTMAAYKDIIDDREHNDLLSALLRHSNSAQQPYKDWKAIWKKSNNSFYQLLERDVALRGQELAKSFTAYNSPADAKMEFKTSAIDLDKTKVKTNVMNLVASNQSHQAAELLATARNAGLEPDFDFLSEYLGHVEKTKKASLADVWEILVAFCEGKTRTDYAEKATPQNKDFIAPNYHILAKAHTRASSIGLPAVAHYFEQLRSGKKVDLHIFRTFSNKCTEGIELSLMDSSSKAAAVQSAGAGAVSSSSNITAGASSAGKLDGSRAAGYGSVTSAFSRGLSAGAGAGTATAEPVARLTH